MNGDKFDLLASTFEGSSTLDVFPISVWKHFPIDDRTPEGLATKELEFQKSAKILLR